MKLKDFSRLVKKDKYQVFLMQSRVTFPYFFAVHTWFVINDRGRVERWEAGKFVDTTCIESFGNVYHGLFGNNPVTGMNINPLRREPKYEGTLVGSIEGDKDSLERRMVDFIGHQSENYPHKNVYKLLGPNSNTYTQWVLDHFPESKLKLPRNAFGKNHAK